MSKVKVKKSFIDKYTKVSHQVGEVFEADDARIAEINQVNPDLIEVQKSAPAPAVEADNAGEGKQSRKKKVGAVNE